MAALILSLANCEIPIWSDDGAGNSLKAEPMCTTKTVTTAVVEENFVSSHLAGKDSIPNRASFPDLGFFCSFSSTVRQLSGKLRSHPSPDIIDHHSHKKSFITGANDL